MLALSAASFYTSFAGAQPLEREIERLRHQANIGWARERVRLAAAGLRDGDRVIEIGCGPGVFASRLRTDFPAAPYTAVDYDERLLSSSQCENNGNGAPVAHICSSADALGVADGTHDFALARFVFQHLSKPLDAAREMRRVLVPGGRAAIIDSDDAFGTLFDPPIAALAPIALKVRLAQALRGGNRNIARRLPRLLRDAGFRDISFEAIVITSDETGLVPFHDLYQADFLRPLVDVGLITHDEADRARRGLDDFFATPDALIIDQRFVVCGTKGTSENG